MSRILESEKGKEEIQLHLTHLKESEGWKFVKSVLEQFIFDYQKDIDNIDRKFEDGEKDRLIVKKVLLQKLLNIPDKYIDALTNAKSDLNEDEGDPFE